MTQHHPPDADTRTRATASGLPAHTGDDEAPTAPPEVVPAVFGSREAAEAAIADLRRLGLSEDDIGIAVPDPGRYRLIDDTTHDAAMGVTSGIAIGVPLGSLAGLALSGIVFPGVGVVGVGGLLIGLYGGVLWGAILGGLGGLAAKVRLNADGDQWCEVALGGGDILVAARAGVDAPEAHRIMERHGARCFVDLARRANAAAGPAPSADARRDGVSQGAAGAGKGHVHGGL